MASSGTLYVVATPIGNLDDITLRALKVLKEVDLVAAEDTRRTRALLSHFGISTPLVSYYDAVESRRVQGLLRRLERGECIALVSDAGTPGVSDPGHRLIGGAAQAGIPIVAVPGPSALTAALAVAAVPHDRFVFEGFLPPRGAARRRRLDALAREERTIVLFEAPHRLARTLEDLRDTLGDRPAVLCRELTKRFEEIRRETLGALHAAVGSGLQARGELTLVVEGKREAGGRGDRARAATEGQRGRGKDAQRDAADGSRTEMEALDAAISAALDAAGREGGTVRDVVDRVVAEQGGRRREIYRRALDIRAGRR
jgi:16S rRNA (cytidine1402-2'-O)-methyltransferase